MSNVTVSVIIPCYKQACFLNDAIESVLAQTHPFVECIVVDDGSPDNTGEVAARYPTVRYIRQENSGVAAARNNGARLSKGEFIVFLDSDDRLYPTAIETNLKYISQRDDCAFVSGQHFLIDENGKRLWQVDQPHVQKDHYRRLLESNFIGCPATVMYRRSMLMAAGGFDTSMKSVEDFKLYLELARVYPVINHMELIAEYRVHASSMSGNLARMLKYAELALKSQWEFVKDDPRLRRSYFRGQSQKKRMYHCEILVEESRKHAREGQWRQALPSMLTLLRHYPGAFSIHALRKLKCVVLGTKSQEGSIAAPSSANQR